MESTFLVGIALLPVVIVGILFGGFRRNGREVGLAVLSVTVFVTVFVPAFTLGTQQLLYSLGDGVVSTLITASILFPALLFYRLQQHTGAIETLFRAMTRVLPSPDWQMLVLVLGVGPCLEACCGFGVGALVVLPLLVRMYDDKMKAVALSLLSQLIAPWGALGLGTFLSLQVSGVSMDILSSYTALLLLPLAVSLSLLALLLSGGREALERSWLMTLVAAGTLLSAICLFSRILAYEVSGLFAGLLVLFILFIWGYAKKRDRVIPPMGLQGPRLSRVCLVYTVLIGGITVTHVFSFLRAWLPSHVTVTDAVMPFQWALFAYPGVWLLVGSLFMIPLFSVQGTTLRRASVDAWSQFFPAIAGLCAFFLTAALMQANGMADALGTLLMHAGENYVWLEPLTSAISGWLMSSFVGGMLLMTPMQVTISSSVGLPLPWAMAAQEAAITLSSAVSPLALLLLTTAAGIVGNEGQLLRMIGVFVLWGLALITLLLVWFVHTSAVTLVLLLLLMNAPLLTLIWFPRRRTAPDLWPVSGESVSAFPRPARRLRVGLLAYGALIGVNVFYASFSLVAAGPIRHIDPIIFLCFAMLLQIPVGLVLLAQSRAHLHLVILKDGLQIGITQGAGLLCFMVALARSGITDAAMCSCLNGVAATFVAWLLFKQRPSGFTWCACLLAAGGGIFIWCASPGQAQGDFTAFLGGLLFTTYAFFIERMLRQQHVKRPAEVRVVIGVILLTMAALVVVAALAFGEWRGMQTMHVTDMLSIGYVSFAAILLPLCAELFILRHVSAVTMSFFMILEPLASAIFAYLAGERLPSLAYVGAVFVLIAVVFQALAGARGSSQESVAVSVRSDAA